MRAHSESAAVHRRYMTGFSSAPTHSSIPRFRGFSLPSFVDLHRSAPGARWRTRSGRDSRGQAVQGVQGEEDVRLALEGARPVPQQLAALQVRGDVLHTDGLREVGQGDERNQSLYLKIMRAHTNKASRGEPSYLLFHRFRSALTLTSLLFTDNFHLSVKTKKQQQKRIAGLSGVFRLIFIIVDMNMS